VTAKDSKGNELFNESKVYMPIPQQLGRGDKMGRGPYEKSGIIRDNGLPPDRVVLETFAIPFPVEEVKKDDKIIRNILDHDMIIEVELMYLPFGTIESGKFSWRKVTRKVSIEKGGV
jgi:hypothetical protein